MDEIHIRGRGRGGGERRGTHRNKHWVAGQENGSHGSDGERWERGGHRGGRGNRGTRGRGGSGRSTPFLSTPTPVHEDPTSGTEDEGQDIMEEVENGGTDVETNDPDDPEERERFWKELVKARELEKKRMIAEKKWADPDAPMRLEDAITPVGTCTDMCPKFERYRREREHNLDKWEVIPGTKRVDHARAVKMYERASGAKSLPSDLRTPETCRRTLDYLFHDLLPRGGFTETHSFIRDRSRAVRNDFTPQLITGAIAIECHDRCARFHIVAMHLQRDVPGFDLRLEEQQLSHALLSLQQFYEDQRGHYTSPTELEMRVYQRLISIRNLKERHEDVPLEITGHPVFQLTTRFLQHVQKESAPISRTSSLRVGQEGMQIFGELAAVLRETNNMAMVYLIACILERLFGKDTIEDMEALRGSLSIPDVIDGISQPYTTLTPSASTVIDEEIYDATEDVSGRTEPVLQNVTEWLESQPTQYTASSFTSAVSSAFGSSNGSFLSSSTSGPPKSAFANIKSVPNAFGTGTFGATGSVFGGSSQPTSVFGGLQSAFNSTSSTSPATVLSPAKTFPFTPPTGGGIFSSDVRDKPFGGLPSVAFGTPPGMSNPTSLNGISSQTTQTGSATAPHNPPSLNPRASSFTPLPSIGSSSSATAPPPAVTTQLVQPLPAPSQPPIHDARPSEPPHTPSLSSYATPAEMPSQSTTPTPPRIIERRQTLWEFPSSESPRRERSHQTPPTLEIPQPRPVYETPTPSTPTEPPQLNRPPPLALPPTPTARWFDPSSQQQAKPGSSSSLLRKQSLIGFPLQMPASPAPTDILSPLHIPSGSLKWPVPTAPSSPTPVASSSSTHIFSPLITQSPVKNKGKAKETRVDLDELADEFMQSHSPVAMYFRKWLRKATDYAAWHDACRRSEMYREKLQRANVFPDFKSSSNGTQASKRRASSGVVQEPQPTKRARRRVSTDYKPAMTDEELVRHLKENQEEHQRRWAQGSFLKTIRRCVEEMSPDSDSRAEWRVWLALNTDNDGTAIWLEHKFDLPQSGEWISDTVFSIPAVPKTTEGRLPLGSPGLVIFERTPLEGITDPIERKYRVLDDCARLRDIVDGLASDPQRRFIPSLLVISWSNGGEEETLQDFTVMVQSFVKSGALKNWSTFSVSSTDKDLDKTFEEVSKSIELEVEDRLMQSISWNDLVDMFVELFKSSSSDWLHSCWAGEHFDWTRYGDVLKALSEAQRQAVSGILSVLGVHQDVQIEIPVDTEAPAHLGIGYATGPFLDAFAKVAVASAERAIGENRRPNYKVFRERLSSSFEEYQGILETISTRLRELGLVALKNWAKRRADGDISPSSTPKRMRSSLSRDTSDTDVSITEDSPPPPSTMAASTIGHSEPAAKPPVTAAMLRALARDILKSR
ncbi:SAC3/GANP/Nin1/mts3/eIF-3 p25 family-domain-containing protein [Cristinia sonorae]|uniref:SAC3/GANP/Nin1/mts3/eIF-3 p25 family-domain-containing protein n=1 Tax=Cristinia sonorae TaxID=1940300 RepID=A0A8K0XTG5_9AGAR|nr:SAC3/GANP/Nin1/mts3/eIF-3 p25 family-domain-containing protein [Cristinia sonorae]